MCEVVLTIHALETYDGKQYPITAIRRYEFATNEQMMAALTELEAASGLVSSEQLR